MRDVVDHDYRGLGWADIPTCALEVGHNHKWLHEKGKLARTERRFNSRDVRRTTK